MRDVISEISEYVFEEFVPDMVKVKDILRAEIKEHTDEYLRNGGKIDFITNVIRSSTEAISLFTSAANDVCVRTTKTAIWSKDRLAARKLGLSKYEREPCKDGHTEFYVNDNQCCECSRKKKLEKKKIKKE